MVGDFYWTIVWAIILKTCSGDACNVSQKRTHHLSIISHREFYEVIGISLVIMARLKIRAHVQTLLIIVRDLNQEKTHTWVVAIFQFPECCFSETAGFS